MGRKLAFAVLTGLMGAALLHIIIILALPNFTGRDAYTRVVAEGPEHSFHSLGDTPDAAGLSNLDPYIKVAVCHFDVTTQPIRLLAGFSPSFWSVAIYDSDSNEVFSMNDRTSVAGVLDVLAASPVQLSRIRKSVPPSLAQSIIVELKEPTGYAVLRAMAPQPSFEQAAREFLGDALCIPFEGY
ncbi:MAG: DUF1254 domain-containing protein [Allorhizobium sp.]